STDAGITWEDRTTGMDELAVYGFAVSDTSVYAATSAGVRVSRDAAVRWQASSLVENPARVVTTGHGVLLTALEGGRLHLSEDEGKTWRALRNPFEGAEVIALAVSPAYAQDRTLFVATSSSTEVVLWR